MMVLIRFICWWDQDLNQEEDGDDANEGTERGVR